MWIVTGKWERKRNIKPKPSPKHKKLANISLKLTKVTPPKKKNNTQHFLIWMSNEGSFDHLGTFGMTILIDNKSYSSKSWHDQIDRVLLTAEYIFREFRVESWTPTAGYTAPSPSPPDWWASRWILYKYTFLILKFSHFVSRAQMLPTLVWLPRTLRTEQSTCTTNTTRWENIFTFVYLVLMRKCT